MTDERLYNVFTRTWWRMEGDKRVPGAGRKHYIARRVSGATARRYCDEYNSTHKPGPLSRKAEFESV